MLTILNPEYPTWEVLKIMLLVAGGIVGFLIMATVIFAVFTTILRLVFVPRTRWKIQKNSVEEFEKLGFKVIYRS